jgi:hypothetical protein
MCENVRGNDGHDGSESDQRSAIETKLAVRGMRGPLGSDASLLWNEPFCLPAAESMGDVGKRYSIVATAMTEPNGWWEIEKSSGSLQADKLDKDRSVVRISQPKS